MTSEELARQLGGMTGDVWTPDLGANPASASRTTTYGMAMVMGADRNWIASYIGQGGVVDVHATRLQQLVDRLVPQMQRAEAIVARETSGQTLARLLSGLSQ